MYKRWKVVETRGDDFCRYASGWGQEGMSEQWVRGVGRSLLRIRGGAKKTKKSKKSDQDKIAKWYKKFPLGMALFDAAGQFLSHLPKCLRTANHSACPESKFGAVCWRPLSHTHAHTHTHTHTHAHAQNMRTPRFLNPKHETGSITPGCILFDAAGECIRISSLQTLKPSLLHPEP